MTIGGVYPVWSNEASGAYECVEGLKLCIDPSVSGRSMESGVHLRMG